jgi:diguanylate cyclase (GGDEF)-like protein
MEQRANQANSGDPTRSLPDHIRVSMRLVSHRQWWLWSTGLVVMMLLAVVLMSFTFTAAISGKYFYRSKLYVALRGLVALLLLFSVYVLYQQFLNHRVQADLECTLTKFQERIERVYKIPGRDFLTNLYNRQFGEERLAAEVSRSERHANPLAVMRLSVKGLAAIREALGQNCADYAIRLFADCLQRAIRTWDVPVRLGDDEFLVLLPECESKDMESVLGHVNRFAEELGKQQLPMEITAGWAEYFAGEEFQALMLRAERTLQSKKQNGNGQNATAIHISVLANRQCESDALHKLRPREREVLKLLAKGKTNKEVAGLLGMSVRTAETHRANIMSQLGVHSLPDLIFFALRNNIIEPPNPAQN